MGWGDRREQRRWQRELEQQLAALPTYDGDTPDGGTVTPLSRSLPRPPRSRPGRRERVRRGAGAGTERRRTYVTIAITVAVVVAVLGVSATPVVAPIRALLGWEGDRGSSSTYAFLQQDPLTGDPVTWSSCDDVRLVVNPDGAPDGWERTLDEAIGEVSRATGLDLELEGTTDDRPGDDRISRLGRAQPVLVAFSDPEETPELDDETVGIAGPRSSNGVYVTGQVVFDGPQFREIDERGDDDLQRSIMMHELAHLMGLDHVDDERQLMYPTTTFQSTFGNGDLEGLRILGDGRCR